MNEPEAPQTDRRPDTYTLFPSSSQSVAVMGDDLPYGLARAALVVEDDWLLRQNLVDDLTAEGWTVFEAECGETALEMMKEDLGIDLLITDIRLGGQIDGWDVAEALRHKDAKLAVIYVSANPALDARQVTGSIFLSKPYVASKLLEACSTLCGPKPN